MDTEVIKRHFEKAGFRVKLLDSPPARSRFGWIRRTSDIELDVRYDKKGEYFEVVVPPDSGTLSVLDTRPEDRHLVLMFRKDGESSKFLCGHDERHLFVAALPEFRTVTTVEQAKAALKPAVVADAEVRKGVRKKNKNARKNKAFIRQGEWFFVPVAHKVVNENLIHRNEPIVRGGGGKPHICAELYREGGETVMVHTQIAPHGLTMDQYRSWVKGHQNHHSVRNNTWRQMTREVTVFVRGKVRHPDHATVDLKGWHLVIPNTEHLSKAADRLTFLD